MLALLTLHWDLPLLLLLKHHLYTFQQTFNTWMEQMRTLGMLHWWIKPAGHLVISFVAVGTFNWNKEHWLSCWALLMIGHNQISHFPLSLKEFNSHFADSGLWCTRKGGKLRITNSPKQTHNLWEATGWASSCSYTHQKQQMVSISPPWNIWTVIKSFKPRSSWHLDFHNKRS